MVKAYDPATRSGSLVRDTPDRTEYELAENALAGSIFRMLRQGQRVIFELDEDGKATSLRLGAEEDMATPAPPPGALE